MARDRQPVVVLLDLDLPDIYGDEVLQRLRADPATKTIPVLVLSANADYRQIQRLLETGAVAYLTKPLDVHDLSPPSTNSSANRRPPRTTNRRHSSFGSLLHRA